MRRSAFTSDRTHARWATGMIRECGTAASKRRGVQRLVRDTQSRIPLFRVLVFRGSETNQKQTAEHAEEHAGQRG